MALSLLQASLPQGEGAMKPTITETHIKQQIKMLLGHLGIFNYHLLQGMGAYKGVQDRVMHYKGRVIYLEIKKPGGKMSIHQIGFEAQCKEDGVDYFVVSSTEELEALLGALDKD